MISKIKEHAISENNNIINNNEQTYKLFKFQKYCLLKHTLINFEYFL